MKRGIFTIAALVCCVLVCFAAATGLTGKWTGTLTLDGNGFPITYIFKADSGKLTGTAESPEGKWEITDGKISGDSLSFAVTVHENMKISHRGKFYAQGDSVGLNIDMNGQTFHTVLKRAADK